MKLFSTLFALLFYVASISAQSAIRGQLQDQNGEAVIYANVALYQSTDSTLLKVETTDDSGVFKITEIATGNYFLKATYVGQQDLVRDNLVIEGKEGIDLGILKMVNVGTDLDAVMVTAQRAMVEVKPDRMVFNVQGTINSVGEDAISLLRKAPGVTVDNNDNVSVLGRTGVLVYIDGKRLPLSGLELSGYLQNLTAEQIDRIDIISNPGAKYEAQGNAGIIDIRLKRDKNLGANGTLSGTFIKSRFESFNLSGSGNYRNKFMNVFASAGYGERQSFNDMIFINYQNDLIVDEINNSENSFDNLNYRIGTDFFITKKQTIGFLVSGGESVGDNLADNILNISRQSTPTVIDSVLVAANTAEFARSNNTFNINYRNEISKDQSFNIDLDYGKYKNDSDRFQPNRYYNNTDREVLLTEIINVFDTPTDIDILTGKIDYENTLLGGKLGLGTKVSQVVSKNTFLFFDQINGVDIRNDERSNKFDYDEKVYAGYISYSRPINQKWNFSAGLRAEQTDAIGELQPFDVSLEEPPVELNYLSWFPSAGLTWTPKREHTFALNYGRRINRPDYQVLNPFENRLSELSFEKGNPTLRPEIVNNIELGYTLKYRYNFKLAYSITEDQITRLIGPDDRDPRAGFITWANLATQKVLNFNVSAPMQIKKWSIFTNLSASYIDNQADYGDEGIVDVQAFTYSIYQQYSFPLFAGLKGEVSGYFAGPGVWGGVFKYNANGALNLGLQRKFIQDKLNVKLSANDIFFTSGWNGESEFNGLVSEGSGRFDSRRVSLALSYNFGNQNVKSRKRKTGLEEESKRVGN